MNNHILKVSPQHFEDLYNGLKTHETRVNDRNYAIGDKLTLMKQLTDRRNSAITGKIIEAEITHILDPRNVDLVHRRDEPVVIMSLRILKRINCENALRRLRH
jgi:hypothetical protein